MDLRALLGNSLSLELTWCESHCAPAYDSGWRTDPCLVAISPQDRSYHLSVAGSEGEVQEYTAAPGELLLVPAGHLHRLRAQSCHVVGINVVYQLLGGVDWLAFFAVPYKLDSVAASEVVKLMQTLVGVAGRRSTLYPVPTQTDSTELDWRSIIAERRILLQILEAILSHSELQPLSKKRLAILKRVEPALPYLHSESLSMLSLSEAARLCRMSERHFRVLFREAVGQSPHHYVLAKRIEQGRALLGNTDLSVTAIARQLDFHDQSHFTKTFKRICGMSPRRYQQDLRRK